ncbi:phosphotransferase [Kocuria atrinae]|uniref:phosphotransferase n=1 Tax=Kocuria atrinae TaxID=592377 RepID=UPI0003103EC5|nr:phosphotransferase [Kocuria atrinae]
MEEEMLTGGNSTTVVRVDDTVRRTVGPWTTAVHQLLVRLRAEGVTEVPESRGVDEDGREVLSYIVGVVPGYPLSEWVWADTVLVAAAQLMRRIHDASTALVGEDLVWQLPTHHPVEVICHNDFAPYNLVFRNGRLRGVIDFDTASPGPRIWDLAYLAYRLVPLTDDAHDGGPPTPERAGRLRLLIDSYEMPYEPAELLAAVAARLEELAAFTDARAAETGRDDFAEHAAMYRRDRDRVLATG